MGAPRVSHQYQASDGASRIQGVVLGIAAMVGVFDKGEVGEVYTCMNPADFRNKLGSAPKAGYENDYYNALNALEVATVNGRCHLTLLVVKTAHYTDPSDPTTLTAAQGSVSFPDSDGTNTITIYDRSHRDSPLSAKITAGSADSTSLFDIEIYDDDVLVDAVRNVNTDPDSPNYVGRAVGSSRDWGVTDLGRETIPVAATATALAGGSDGLTGLVDADFEGAESAKGRTGWYLFKPYVSTLQKPEYLFCPRTFDDPTLAQSMADFAVDNYMIPVLATPAGLNREDARDYRNGTGDYSASAAFGDSIGGQLMVWPHYTPKQLMSTSPKTRISPEGLKVGLLAAAIGRDWIHQAAAGFEYGDLRGVVGELERDTDEADSELLDPIGIQVIRSDLELMVWGHRTLSSNPDFADEQIRRLDNFAIHSINLATQAMLHRPLTLSRCRMLERNITEFFRNIFTQHPEAFSVDAFDDAVKVDVLGQNTVGSTDWMAGKLYSFWSTFWSPAIQEIIHRYSHHSGSSAAV